MTKKLPNKASASDTDKIIREYQPRIKAFIRHNVANSEDAEDIEQDVFYQMLKTIDEAVNPIQQISAWLYKVAKNTIINKSKKKKEFLFINNDEMDVDSELKDISGILFSIDYNNSPEMEYLRSLVWLELEDALRDLPVEQREIFELTEFDGIPVKEISGATGIALNTLLSRKHYAVIFLRKRLKRIYHEIIDN